MVTSSSTHSPNTSVSVGLANLRLMCRYYYMPPHVDTYRCRTRQHRQVPSFALQCASPIVRLACELEHRLLWGRLSLRRDDAHGDSRYTRSAMVQLCSSPEDPFQSTEALQRVQWWVSRPLSRYSKDGGEGAPLSELTVFHVLGVLPLTADVVESTLGQLDSALLRRVEALTLCRVSIGPRHAQQAAAAGGGDAVRACVDRLCLALPSLQSVHWRYSAGPTVHAVMCFCEALGPALHSLRLPDAPSDVVEGVFAALWPWYAGSYLQQQTSAASDEGVVGLLSPQWKEIEVGLAPRASLTPDLMQLSEACHLHVLHVRHTFNGIMESFHRIVCINVSQLCLYKVDFTRDMMQDLMNARGAGAYEVHLYRCRVVLLHSGEVAERAEDVASASYQAAPLTMEDVQRAAVRHGDSAVRRVCVHDDGE